MNEYCKVVYLDRTSGVSSSEIRTEERLVTIGIAGDYVAVMDKFVRESAYVNGVKIGGLCAGKQMPLTDRLKGISFRTEDYGELLERVDAVSSGFSIRRNITDRSGRRWSRENM